MAMTEGRVKTTFEWNGATEEVKLFDEMAWELSKLLFSLKSINKGISSNANQDRNK